MDLPFHRTSQVSGLPAQGLPFGGGAPDPFWVADRRLIVGVFLIASGGAVLMTVGSRIRAEEERGIQAIVAAVNRSGRQRALAERIAKDCALLAYQPHLETAWQELTASSADLVRQHAELYRESGREGGPIEAANVRDRIARIAPLVKRLAETEAALRKAAGNQQARRAALVLALDAESRMIPLIDGLNQMLSQQLAAALAENWAWLRLRQAAFLALLAGTLALIAIPALRGLRARAKALEHQARELHRLTLVAHLTDQAVLLVDAELRIQWVNQGFMRLTGYSSKEVRGRALAELLGVPAAGGDFFLSFAAQVKEGHGFRREMQQSGKDGVLCWVEIEAAPVSDDAGGSNGWILIQTDISERRRREEQLRSSLAAAQAASRELQFRQYSIDQAAIVAETDPAGRITYVNQKFCQISGYSEAELLGQNHRILNSGLHPRSFFEEMYATIRVGKVWRGEIRNRAKDGRLYWVETTVIPSTDANGKVIKYTAIRFDITDRKEAEEKERAASEWNTAILASAGFAIVATSPDGIIRTFNAAAEQMLGYRADELVGKHTPEIFHERSEVAARAVQFSQELGMRMEPGFEVFVAKARLHLPNEHEWTYVRKDGSTLPVLLSVSASRDREGKVTGFLGVAADIMVRKLAEVQVDRARKEAENSVRAKSDFLANMSHEIRTPMNGVIGMTGLLLDTPLSDTQRDYAETVRRSAESLLGLINDILDFSKIEAGKLDIETIDFDPRVAVEEAVELLAAGAASKGLELICEVDAAVPERAAGDPGRVRQILLNLLSNAIKFTAHGEVVVRVAAAQGDEQSMILRCAVTDTGPGISEEAGSKLFQPFQQVDSSITRRFGGTGLGLAICAQLAERMGGTVGVESSPGKGSTFWFTVRLETRPNSPRIRTTDSALAGVRVLIVDDNATNRNLLLAMTAGWAMRADAADSPSKALALAAAAVAHGQPYRVSLLDYMMPDMDGLALARELRALAGERSLGQVLLSSAPERSRVAGDVAAGIDAYLAKPIRRAALERCLHALLVRPELEISLPNPAAVRGPHLVPRDDAQRKCRVLVAEDNAVNQKIVLRLLEKAGHRADVVGDGREAVEALSRMPYDVVLMDCQMPEMDGFAATREIRRLQREGRFAGRLPIIAMTASAMAGDRERCLEAGMDDYISKPIRPEQLAGVVERWKSDPAVRRSALDGAADASEELVVEGTHRGFAARPGHAAVAADDKVQAGHDVDLLVQRT
ncbi:MAG: PAS domain S-box protein [Bryobacteraceae bacterium]